MAQQRRAVRTVRAAVILLIAVLTATSAGAPALANEAHEEADKAGENRPQAGNEVDRKKVRKTNDYSLKAGEPLYSRQAESLAQQYRETAEIIARQGGDPQPVLDAAAYFEKQSELSSASP